MAGATRPKRRILENVLLVLWEEEEAKKSFFFLNDPPPPFLFHCQRVCLQNSTFIDVIINNVCFPTKIDQ